MHQPASPSTSSDHPIHLVFIHHSVGGQWLADQGVERGADCIYASHPNGGGLRTRLEQHGYMVHEASYHSRIGDRTDVFDWLPKFRELMARMMACRQQDSALDPPLMNRIILFKSCYPNNMFVGPGDPPGNPQGPELTVANAKAAYRALLAEFRKYPAILFVCVTTPAVAPAVPAGPFWKLAACRVLRRPSPRQRAAASARMARQFANWLKAPEGWLQDYPLQNVTVFDYYDLLTGEGVSDVLQYPTNEGLDSHPSAEGQHRATEAFVPFLNRAVQQAHVG